MKILFCPTLKKYNKKNLPGDILTGIIIAAVSIPISMGYAQIAGLPAVYGLYGSVFPILVFALFSTSPQFIFGVDAAPAALVGAELLALGIETGSKEAAAIVPVITFFTALWLLVFYIFKTGKLVNYISKPVMGGFISGICCTIFFMQVPKLYGGTPGTGEFFELAAHIVGTWKDINMPSLVLGLATFAILIISKKLVPKFPMAAVIMAAGAMISYAFPLSEKGVAMLAAVEKGLPAFSMPDVINTRVFDVLGVSLSIAVVIMAETLLAENSLAQKNGYTLNDNQELLAFSLGNFAAAFTGCCPMNGSVSRSSMGEQYGGKTQLVSIVAGAAMIAVLLFGTGFIGYLPVPVLTAIVLSALMSATEFHLAKKLWKVSRTEFKIFCGAFLGVLILGTINGVLIGVILSFAAVIIKAAYPPRSFLGMVPGHNEFVDSAIYKHAFPLKKVVIYRFSSNLFFANVGIFQNDIMNSLKEDTKVVIVDAAAIGSIDVTASERLEQLYKDLKARHIKFFLTEHISDVNEQLRKLGLFYMIEEGAVRQTIPVALKSVGIVSPYVLEGGESKTYSIARKRMEDSAQEFIWAFGDVSEEAIERLVSRQIEHVKTTGDVDSLMKGVWGDMSLIDEDEWLEHIEGHLEELVRISGEEEHVVAERLEQRRRVLLEKIAEEHPELIARFKKKRQQYDEHLKVHHPEIYKKVLALRDEFDLKEETDRKSRELEKSNQK